MSTSTVLKNLHIRKQKYQAVVANLGAVVLMKKNTKTKAQLHISTIIVEIKGQDRINQGLKIKLGNRYIFKRQARMICNLERRLINEENEDNERNEMNNNRETIETKLRPT